MNMRKIDVEVDVWNCTIRLFANVRGVYVNLSGYVSKREMEKAEQLVNRNGAANISGQYGAITISISEKKLAEAVVAELIWYVSDLEKKLHETEKKRVASSNLLYDLCQDVARHVKQDKIIARVKEAAAFYDADWPGRTESQFDIWSERKVLPGDIVELGGKTGKVNYIEGFPHAGLLKFKTADGEIVSAHVDTVHNTELELQ